MKKAVLAGLIVIALTLSLFALAEPSAALKSIYEALTDASATYNTPTVLIEYTGGTIEATLTDDAIILTETKENEAPLSWTFMQEGDWVTASMGPNEDEGRTMAYWLLNTAISVQGVNRTLFIGYINAVRELQSQYLTYDESEGEKKVSVNIVGPYEYDLDAMDTLVLSEAFLREEGWTPLGEEFDAPGIIFGKVKVDCIGNADGAAISVMEYGELDELAFKAVLSVASVLQPRGWEDFVANYTELKDADEAGFTAMIDPDEAATEDLFIYYKEGYTSACFTIGEIDFE